MSFRELLGTELPLVQAPMAGSQGSALAVAVSNAGGLGALPCAMLGTDALRSELAAIRQGTARPFNVNFFCHQDPEPDAERERRWRALLAPYYAELSIDPTAAPATVKRSPFSREAAKLLREFRPPIVSFHFGLPSAELIAVVRDWGAKVLSSATTVAEARWLEARGVDGIIAQGYEAGGHRGMFLESDLGLQVGTLALVPRVARAVRVPVIAAGGIADARGVAAALSLGASAAQVGTAFLLCPESTTSRVHREALGSDAAGTTALTNLFSGRPARGIVNRLMGELGPLSDQVPAFPLAANALAPLRARCEALGRGDFSPLWAGQNPSGCTTDGAAVLTRRLAGVWAATV